MKSYFEVVQKLGVIPLFLFFCLCSLFLNVISSEFVSTDSLYEEYVASEMAEKYGDNYDELAAEFEGEIEEFKDPDSSFEIGLDFLEVAIFFALKFTIIVAFLFVAITLILPDSISSKDIFKVVIAGEFIFLLPKLAKSSWFIFALDSYQYEDITKFDPFSILVFFGTESIDELFMYPLSLINPFEMFYAYCLVSGVGFFSLSQKKPATPVILGYAFFLLFTVSIRMYLTIII